MISGGEKQRLAIARMLLKNPRIMFFDEATSALDSHTETELMRNINTLLQTMHRTSVFIAHRLRTVEDSDHIIVLNHGHVIERGTHESLLNHHGLYYDLWLAQMERISQDGNDSEEEKTESVPSSSTQSMS